MSTPAIPPLHPTISPRLSVEWHAFHNSHTSHGPPLHEVGWSPTFRDPPAPGGPKMGRDPAEGVRNKELVVSWKAGGPGLGDGFGEGEGQCDVGVFWPEKAVDDGRGLPVFIYIHGGGWVKAPPATSSFITRTSREVPCVMIVPRPRVAPEDPFPAPLEDVWGIVRWALDGSAEKELAALGEKGPGKVDWSKIALGGASAGGNLAAAIATSLSMPPLLERFPNPFVRLLLFAPVLDNTADISSKYPSWSENKHCPHLPSGTMLLFRSLYLANSPSSVSPSHRLISPINAPASSLAQLPPLWVDAADCDLVRDEPLVFAQKVRQAGGTVCHERNWEGVEHAFTIMDEVLETARVWMGEVVEGLKEGFEEKRGRDAE